jgi:hypothetical protein
VGFSKGGFGGAEWRWRYKGCCNTRGHSNGGCESVGVRGYMAIDIHPNRGGDESCGGGGGGGGMRWQLLDMDDGDCSKAWGFFPFHIYKPPKNLLKLTSSELPLDPEPVLPLLVRLGEVDEEVEEEVDMRAARSSYRGVGLARVLAKEAKGARRRCRGGE